MHNIRNFDDKGKWNEKDAADYRIIAKALRFMETDEKLKYALRATEADDEVAWRKTWQDCCKSKLNPIVEIAEDDAGEVHNIRKAKTAQDFHTTNTVSTRDIPQTLPTTFDFK